jgi:hypothetical protein
LAGRRFRRRAITGPRMGGVPVYQIPYRMNFRIVERWQFGFALITTSTRTR